MDGHDLKSRGPCCTQAEQSSSGDGHKNKRKHITNDRCSGEDNRPLGILWVGWRRCLCGGDVKAGITESYFKV